MKAAYLLDGAVHVGTLPDPVPGKGQVLVRTHSCGLCASDLHLCQHGERLVAWSKAHGGNFDMDLSRPVVMGHEYVAEIVDYGPGTERTLPRGTLVTSPPHVIHDTGKGYVGLSNDYPGGYGELMLLSEALLSPVSATRDADIVAMAEPLNVGLGYVKAARLQKGDVPLVVGCGAIGLSVIMALRIAGIAPVIAADFSERRRAMAIASGADIAVDPRDLSPYAPHAAIEGKVPNVVFECVGTPGVLNDIICRVAPGSRLLVAGWCLEPDTLFTAAAHVKRLAVQFGGGTSNEMFLEAVRALNDGTVDPTPWFGHRIGLSQLGDSLAAMADPESPIRTIVDPRLG